METFIGRFGDTANAVISDGAIRAPNLNVRRPCGQFFGSVFVLYLNGLNSLIEFH
jgi:hypothetical protein